MEVKFIMEKKIIEVLKDLGVPMGNLGFKYIREAVLIIIADQSKLDGITKHGGLYYTVAKKYGTAPSRVERAIRHAIEQSFIHLDLEILQKYFGNTADLNSGKLSNRNFLAALAYAISEDNALPIATEMLGISEDNNISCAICRSGHRLIKVDDHYLCMVCLHKANLSLTVNEQ
jgi:hypothetical protein